MITVLTGVEEEQEIMVEAMCKNCIHDGVCVYQETINDIEEWLAEFGCGYYKHAADIVHCDECKFSTNNICDLDESEKPAGHYCGFGERREPQ